MDHYRGLNGNGNSSDYLGLNGNISDYLGLNGNCSDLKFNFFLIFVILKMLTFSNLKEGLGLRLLIHITITSEVRGP